MFDICGSNLNFFVFKKQLNSELRDRKGSPTFGFLFYNSYLGIRLAVAIVAGESSIQGAFS